MAHNLDAEAVATVNKLEVMSEPLVPHLAVLLLVNLCRVMEVLPKVK